MLALSFKLRGPVGLTREDNGDGKLVAVLVVVLKVTKDNKYMVVHQKYVAAAISLCLYGSGSTTTSIHAICSNSNNALSTERERKK